ncbi:MAG: dTDP-4-dehydrorhamnose 3,5-epimerase [Desulfobacterales bacterium]|jgi:dTDP-4-dehydrorhamnose 3,5-epimerase
MEIESTRLNGVLLVTPDIYRDRRGYFLETHHRRRYRQMGIDAEFVQDNLSYSVRGTLRGLHFQRTQPQAKLVTVLSGEIFDVAVDIRPGSPAFGQWVGVRLAAEQGRQLFIPEGFAHGFCVLSLRARVHYKCTDFYTPEDEGGILWSDPGIGIQWPVKSPLVSDKDGAFPTLANLGSGDLPDVRASQ